MERAIEVTGTARVSFALARRALVRNLDHVLGDGHRSHRSARRILAELEMPFDGSAVRRWVEIDVTGIHLDHDHGRWELAWHALDKAALFPVFRGELDVEEQTSTTTDLRLHGTYRPPLGVVGAFGDGLVGRRLARRSVEAFLDVLARNIETAASAEQGQRS